jgi:hypothetical protein
MEMWQNPLLSRLHYDLAGEQRIEFELPEDLSEGSADFGYG